MNYENFNLNRLSESEAVNRVIGVIANDTGRSKARTESESARFLRRASVAINYHEPLTLQQRAMNTRLSELRAGQESCDEAWTLYHRFHTGEAV